MRTELKRLHAAVKGTFVYVTHDQAEAMTMADRIVVMHQGAVQQVGPPLTVYGDPVNRFVAGFFGVPAMNFIEGELAEEAGGLAFRAGDFHVALGRQPSPPVRTATLGARPEHVRLSGYLGWPAMVNLVEPMGDETLMFLEYGGPGILVAKADADARVTVGDRCHFTLNTKRLLFFDGKSGERILR
jgi:multiple sugar transport system ATP-binding protein